MERQKKSALYVVMVLGAALVAALTFYGCGGSSGSSSTGTLKLAITDRMSDEFKNVVISIREIRVVPAGKENAPDNDPGLPLVVHYATPRVIDVMTLKFKQEALGEDVILPAGNYSQIRLILAPNPTGQQPPVNYLVLNSDTPIHRFRSLHPAGSSPA